jgi:hypothetical protein
MSWPACKQSPAQLIAPRARNRNHNPVAHIVCARAACDLWRCQRNKAPSPSRPKDQVAGSGQLETWVTELTPSATSLGGVGGSVSVRGDVAKRRDHFTTAVSPALPLKESITNDGTRSTGHAWDSVDLGERVGVASVCPSPVNRKQRGECHEVRCIWSSQNLDKKVWCTRGKTPAIYEDDDVTSGRIVGVKQELSLSVSGNGGERDCRDDCRNSFH